MSDTPSQRFAWDWAGWWTLVFLANLPVPLLFSWGVVRNGCGYGLFGAVAMLFLLGATACGLRWRVGRSLCWGGAVVAATQCLPLLQIYAGYFAITLWDEISGVSSFSESITAQGGGGWELMRANFGVCAVVFLTALPFMFLAILLGAGIRSSRGDRPIWFARRTDPDAS